MHVVIHHRISDPVKWERTEKNIMSMIDKHQLPAGLKPLEYLPSVDGRKALCVWQAPSVAAVQKFIDGQTGGAAQNEYFEVKEQAAIGLPKGEDLARAA